MLDESVAKGFRSMGRGYQARINRILQTWLQLQIFGHFDWDKVGDSILEENMDAAIAEYDEMERLQEERIKKGSE